MTRECQNCMWWRPYGNAGGECRGGPPVSVNIDGHLHARWPLVMGNEWCGAFRIREDKTQGTES
jgi:hypothetical protein